MAAAVDYLAELGRLLRGTGVVTGTLTLREALQAAMNGIRAYEQGLSLELVRMLRDAGATIYGISDIEHLTERVPTICFNLPGIAPAAVTEAAAGAGIGIRDGHMYAPRLMKRLGLAVESGAVRASLAHYNTSAEIHQLGEVLARLLPSRR